MTQRKTYEICCPDCGRAQQVELYESINVSEAPELKEQLLQNQVNTVACEACEFNFRVEKPLLYHDSERGFMVYWIPATEADIEAGQKQFESSLNAITPLLPEEIAAPEIHLVFNRIELVERIFMLEEGLNERVIEYVKYIIYSKNSSRIPPGEKILLFNAQDSTPEALCFVIQDAQSGQLEGMLQYNREAYTALAEMFDRDEQTPDLLEVFPGPYINARRLLVPELFAMNDADSKTDAAAGHDEPAS
jgi:hypothetical protein